MKLIDVEINYNKSKKSRHFLNSRKASVIIIRGGKYEIISTSG